MTDESGRTIRAVRYGTVYRITTRDGLCYSLPASLYNEVYLKLDAIECAIRTHHWHRDEDTDGSPTVD
jgi:hypothetical protein